MAAPDPSAQAKIYKPLDSSGNTIRLVSILPGTGELQVSLEEAEVSSQYIALSYVWGDPLPVQRVLVNNQPFEIRNNLHEYLLQARSEALLSPIWIDAVCINQHDVKERNEQVQRMGSIFSGAFMVSSWLGQGDSEVEEFMDIASAIAGELRTDPESNQSVLGEKAAYRACYLALHQHIYRSTKSVDRFGSLVKSVVDLPYFTRAWITQEVFLAQKQHVVMYGRHNLDWWLFRMILSIADKWHLGRRATRTPAFRLLRSVTDRLNKADPRSIVDFLHNHSPAKCSDPRDHVYALQALWTGTPYTVTVDYSDEPLCVFVDLVHLLFPSIIVPFSYIITFVEMLEIFPWTLLSPKWPPGTGRFIDITLSIFQPRQRSWKQLRESREAQAVDSHIHICTCEYCLPLRDMDDASTLCDWHLYSDNRDNAQQAPNDLMLHFVRITTSKTTVHGIAESQWERETDGLLLILPTCLNGSKDLPRVEEKSGKPTVVLSLESLCRLLSHLQPVLTEKGVTGSSYQFSYWGIDSSVHDILPEPQTSPTADGQPRDYKRGRNLCTITKERRMAVEEIWKKL